MAEQETGPLKKKTVLYKITQYIHSALASDLDGDGQVNCSLSMIVEESTHYISKY